MHLGSEKLHTKDVEFLAGAVFFAHVNLALQTEQGTDGCSRHSMLPCARLCNDSFLSHAHRQKALAQGIVDLVGAGVVEVLPLDRNLEPGLRANAMGIGERGRASHVIFKVARELGPKRRISPCSLKFHFQLFDGGNQCFGDVAAPVVAKATTSIGTGEHD